MELIERYLQAVRTFLPAKNSQDILTELRENLFSEMEEKEALLGRPLSIEEQETLIRRHGHPIAVAARFGPQQQFIGPAIFPFYWVTLKAALLIAFVARMVATLLTVLITNGGVAEFGRMLPGLPAILLTVFGAITLAFALLEYVVSTHQVSSKWKWRPSQLPALRPNRRSISRVESAAGFIFGIGAAVWWQAWPAAPFLIFGPAALFIRAAPVWDAFHWPILLLIAARALLSAFDLLRPNVALARECVDLGLDGVQLTVLGLLLRAGIWIVPASLTGNPAQMEHIALIVNQGFHYALAIGLIIGLIQLAVKCYKLYRPLRSNAGLLSAACIV